MSDLLADSTGDIDTSEPDLQFNSGVDAIIQHLKQRLLTFEGEWYIDTELGVPYFDLVFVKGADPVILDAVFKNAILGTPGVTELLSFDMDITAGRELELTFRAKATDDLITFEQFLIRV